MKEFLAGAGVVLIVVLVVIVISKLMKKTARKEKREKRDERLYSNRDLIGYYVGHPSIPSSRVVAPLRPNIYVVPNNPVVIKRPRRLRRLFW
jgi:hypothetical protein